MAEAHKFTTLDKAIEAFGDDLPWRRDGDGNVSLFDEKAGDYVGVAKGQFVYKVGTRFEVRDTEELPKSVKPATPKDEKAVEKALEKKEEAKAEKSEDSE